MASEEKVICRTLGKVDQRQLILNGVEIAKRADGMINATSLCKAGRKKWANYYRLQSTKDLINALERGSEVSNDIIDTKQGGIALEQGTWVCREVAVDLAAWISMDFRLQVLNWAYAIMKGDFAGVIPDTIKAYDTLNDTSTVRVDSVANGLKRKCFFDFTASELKRQKSLMAHWEKSKKMLQGVKMYMPQDDIIMGDAIRTNLGLSAWEHTDVTTAPSVPEVHAIDSVPEGPYEFWEVFKGMELTWDYTLNMNTLVTHYKQIFYDTFDKGTNETFHYFQNGDHSKKWPPMIFANKPCLVYAIKKLCKRKPNPLPKKPTNKSVKGK